MSDTFESFMLESLIRRVEILEARIACLEERTPGKYTRREPTDLTFHYMTLIQSVVVPSVDDLHLRITTDDVLQQLDKRADPSWGRQTLRAKQMYIAMALREMGAVRVRAYAGRSWEGVKIVTS